MFSVICLKLNPFAEYQRARGPARSDNPLARVYRFGIGFLLKTIGNLVKPIGQGAERPSRLMSSRLHVVVRVAPEAPKKS